MPSDKSIYEKIYLVLSIAKSVKVTSLGELQAEIAGRNPPNFLTRKYDPEKDSFVPGISGKSIRRVLNLCKTLGLLDTTGVLTDEGREALRRTRFDDVIATQARLFLRRNGLSIPDLNKSILKKLQSNPPVMPTCKELWTEIDSELKYSDFSRMLTLLSQCGGAESVQKKIYLNINLK